jgi:hypothetical protein
MRRLALAALVLSLPLARPARAEDEKPDPIDATRGYVGYAPGLVQGLAPEERRSRGIERETGLYVAHTVPGSPAVAAGLLENDVILKVNGVALDVSKIDRDDEAGWTKWQKETFKPITSKIKPGDKVEMVIERAGKTLTLAPVAMSKAEYDFLTAVAADDAKWGPVPDPAAAGPAKEASFDFESTPEESKPDGFYAGVGLWNVVVDEGTKNHVLRQEEMIPTADRLLAMLTGEGHAYADATVSCRARLRGGEQAASAGILFRMRARGDGYAAVADGVARTFSILALERGKPRVVASVALPSPKLKEWHALSVTFAGRRIEAAFDAVKVAGEDGAFASGWCGVTCDKDSQTDFDDFKVVPAAK